MGLYTNELKTFCCDGMTSPCKIVLYVILSAWFMISLICELVCLNKKAITNCSTPVISLLLSMLFGFILIIYLIKKYIDSKHEYENVV